MKSFTIYLSIFLGFVINSYAQVSIKPSLESFGLPFSEIRIKNNRNIPVSFDDSMISVKNAFGNPSTQEDYYYEMDETDGYLLKYGVNDIYIEEGVFFSFYFRESGFKVGINGNFIQVGDDISKVGDLISNYEDKLSYSSYTKSHFLSIPFIVNGEVNDAKIVITYDNASGKIISIMRHDP